MKVSHGIGDMANLLIIMFPPRKVATDRKIIERYQYISRLTI